MESDVGLVLADYGTRATILNHIISKLKNGEVLKLQDERFLMELVVLLNGRNTKLSGSLMELLGRILEPDSYHIFFKVLPHLTDFLGIANEETLKKLQKFYKEFFRLSNQQQKVKIVNDGLAHPSWEVKVAMMKIVYNLEGNQEQVFYGIKDQLNSLLNESKEQQVHKHAKDIIKKMEVVVNQPSSQSLESGKETSKFKAIETIFDEYLSQKKNQVNNTRTINILLSDLATVPDAAGNENVKLKTEALIKLRNDIGPEKFGTFALQLRNSLKHQHPEIVKEAVITVTVLLLKGMLVKESQDYIPLLIQCLGSYSDSVSMFAFVALQHLIKDFPTRAVLVNLLFYVNSESPAIRRKVAHLISVTLRHFGSKVLESSFLGLEQSMECGLNDKDSEVQAHWRRIFLTFISLFERMAERISFIDDKKDSRTIARQKSNGEDHKILDDVKLLDIAELSSGNSIVINATFLGVKVTVRKVFEHDEKRIKKERLMFKLTRSCHGFTQMLHELQFENMVGFVMTQFESNLNDAVMNGILQKEFDKVKVVKDIAKSLEFIHSQGFVHNSLEPRHVLLHFSNNSFEVLLRNFGRSGLESEAPVYSPSVDWTAPEALAAPTNFSKRSDIYSLGVVSYFLWSSGNDHKDKDLSEGDIEKDLKLSKPLLAKMAISSLTTTCNKRPTARLFQIFPIFWKRGSYRFYVERLREFFRRQETGIYQFKISMNWTNNLAISQELKNEMEFSKYYKDHQVDLVMFLRNLSIHGRESEEKRKICGEHNQLLEQWIEKNFERQLMQIFERTVNHYDEQLISELLSITL